jgi:HD-GYP domain-containing protein (c-di-GMP phosphodiesterase class II)
MSGVSVSQGGALTKLEIVYDITLADYATGERTSPGLIVRSRTGSLSEINRSGENRAVCLYVTTPSRLRTTLLRDVESRKKLHKLRRFGIMVLDTQNDPLTVRLRKVITDREKFPVFLGTLRFPFSQADLSHALALAAETLFMKCNEDFYRSVLSLREAETRAMHELGRGFSGEASLHEVSKIVLEKCLAVASADAGFLLFAEDLFEDALPNGIDVRVLGHIGPAFRLFAQSGAVQSVQMRADTLHREHTPALARLTASRRSFAWSAFSGILQSQENPMPLSIEAQQLFKTARKGYKIENFAMVPLIVPTGGVIGCLLLVNKRTDSDGKGREQRSQNPPTLDFSLTDLVLLEALMAQAGVSLDHERLVKNLKIIFESFVKASVLAIESRDPSTKGHSVRVARLTVALAQEASDNSAPEFAQIRFSQTQLYELEYASLLHDFGKIGVREDVLQKDKKLFPSELSQIKERFLHLERHLYIKCIETYLEGLMRRGAPPTEFDITRIRNEVRKISRELSFFWNTITEANEPHVVASGSFQAIAEIAAIKVVLNGQEEELLTSEEISRLSIRKGSLTESERREIEQHVTNSYKFLLQIPWTTDLAQLPGIVFAHHERLDGSGYPRGLVASQIPVQAQIMTICDIYDALVAMDRPYKKALSHELAMNILEAEAREGKIETSLLRLFQEKQVFKLILNDDLKVAG